MGTLPRLQEPCALQTGSAIFPDGICKKFQEGGWGAGGEGGKPLYKGVSAFPPTPSLPSRIGLERAQKRRRGRVFPHPAACCRTGIKLGHSAACSGCGDFLEDDQEDQSGEADQIAVQTAVDQEQCTTKGQDS